MVWVLLLHIGDRPPAPVELGEFKTQAVCKEYVSKAPRPTALWRLACVPRKAGSK